MVTSKIVLKVSYPVAQIILKKINDFTPTLMLLDNVIVRTDMYYLLLT